MLSETVAWCEPKTPEQIMTGALEKYELDELYVLFSGGKDSASVLHYIVTNYPDKFAGAVFTNTGLGAQTTRKFALDYCKDNNIKLYMTWARDKERFYKIVMKHGFAGKGNHQMWMGFLKYHSWHYFMLDRLALGKKCAFISGVRKKESWARNMRRLYTKSPVDKDGRLIFIKPFLYKNGNQLSRYFITNGLKATGMYQFFDKSCECYCGAFALPWELKLMEKYDKLAFDTVKWLEKQIVLHGSKKAMKFNQWGNGPKSKDIAKQKTFEDYCGESCEV